jgi:Bifunctional DNA primase/polymerase, N-terminal/Primase C terminal 1 (PriCT-1)
MQRSLVSAALTLATKGLFVLPCRPRDKRPATRNGLKDATTDLDTIRQWWRREPDLNVAILTGKVSGVFVLDLDGLDAEVELRRLERENGRLPATVESITARGRHVYFRMPAVPIRNSASRIAPGIDVRGDGGYVLAPPSVHPGGKIYSWSADSGAGFATAPQWLLSEVTDRVIRDSRLHGRIELRNLASGDVEEGQRNDAVTRFFGYLLRRLDPMIAVELIQLWNASHCRPPLSCEEVIRIVDSIAGRELRQRFGHGRF